MKGQAVQAISNALATNCTAGPYLDSKPLRRRQFWLCDETSKALGPMEMKFEQAGSLISLNIEATFTCNDVGKLTKSDKEVVGAEKKEAEAVAEDKDKDQIAEKVEGEESKGEVATTDKVADQKDKTEASKQLG